MMRISYTFHTNLKMQKSQFLALFYMNLSKISHASRKIITESEYVIRFLKYLAEVVNFDPFHDVTNYKLGGQGTRFIFLQQIELET